MDHFLLSSYNSTHIKIGADLVAIVSIPFAKFKNHSEKLRADLVVYMNISYHFLNASKTVWDRND